MILEVGYWMSTTVHHHGTDCICEFLEHDGGNLEVNLIKRGTILETKRGD